MGEAAGAFLVWNGEGVGAGAAVFTAGKILPILSILNRAALGSAPLDKSRFWRSRSVSA